MDAFFTGAGSGSWNRAAPLIEAELPVLAAGRRIDLRTAQDLSRYFRDEIVRTAEVQYAV
jgi:hypothetical protein